VGPLNFSDTNSFVLQQKFIGYILDVREVYLMLGKKFYEHDGTVVWGAGFARNP
jgi:hypothetical protein